MRKYRTPNPGAFPTHIFRECARQTASTRPSSNRQHPSFVPHAVTLTTHPANPSSPARRVQFRPGGSGGGCVPTRIPVHAGAAEVFRPEPWHGVPLLCPGPAPDRCVLLLVLVHATDRLPPLATACHRLPPLATACHRLRFSLPWTLWLTAHRALGASDKHACGFVHALRPDAASLPIIPVNVLVLHAVTHHIPHTHTSRVRARTRAQRPVSATATSSTRS